MTYQDIYTKFLIEYDKANVTSSYPSLTEYEVATILDKAYLALLWQKITGNNTRRAPFEYDYKAISDIQPLVVHKTQSLFKRSDAPADNVISTSLPDDYFSFVDLFLYQTTGDNNYDTKKVRSVPTKLI